MIEPPSVERGMRIMNGSLARPLFHEITYVTLKQIQHLPMEMSNLRFFRVFESYPTGVATAASCRGYFA